MFDDTPPLFFVLLPASIHAERMGSLALHESRQVQEHWQAAGAAFNRIFGSYDNHDTAAPLLIAAPVAFAVFLLVLPAAFATSAWLLRRLGKAFRTRP